MSTALPENRGRTWTAQRLVQKMSFPEKAMLLRMFIDKNIVEKCGEDLVKVYDEIGFVMCNHPDVRAATKEALYWKSVDNYRNN